MGLGPMTGRGAGYCAGFGMPGFMSPMGGRGIWGGGYGGRGGGCGWRHWFHATGLPGWMRFAGYAAPDPEMEKQALKNQADALQSELDLIKKRLGEIETQTAKE
jgi:hypothetical protein